MNGVLRATISGVFAMALFFVGAGVAAAATVTETAEFDIPADASGFADVKFTSGVSCDITANFTLDGVTKTFSSNGPTTSFSAHFVYKTGSKASKVVVSATCEFDDSVYGDPGFEMSDPFVVVDQAVGNGLLPSTGGTRLALLALGVALVLGGGYGAYRLRSE